MHNYSESKTPLLLFINSFWMQRWHQSLFALSECSLAFLQLYCHWSHPACTACAAPPARVSSCPRQWSRWHSGPSLPPAKPKTDCQTKRASPIRQGTGSVATLGLPFCSWGFALRWRRCARSGCELSAALPPGAPGTFGNPAASRGPAGTAAPQSRARPSYSRRDATGIWGQALGSALPGNAGKRHGTAWALSDGDVLRTQRLSEGTCSPANSSLLHPKRVAALSFV